LPMPQRQQVIQ